MTTERTATASIAGTEANKEIVRRVFETFRSGNVDAFDDLIVPNYVQHNPQVENGLEPVKGFFGQAGPIDLTVHKLVAEGDIVMAHVEYRTFNSAIVDIFRVIDGRIVEHWDVAQPIAETTASGNDMFSQLS